MSRMMESQHFMRMEGKRERRRRRPTTISCPRSHSRFLRSKGSLFVNGSGNEQVTRVIMMMKAPNDSKNSDAPFDVDSATAASAHGRSAVRCQIVK